jgi:hypothetical protein
MGAGGLQGAGTGVMDRKVTPGGALRCWPARFLDAAEYN